MENKKAVLQLEPIVEPSMHRCPICAMRFTQECILVSHMRIHSPNDIKPHKCPHCELGFNAIENLRRHIHAHDENPPYTCPICGLGFYGYTTQLMPHMATHSQNPTFTAPYSSKGPKPHKCPHCGNGFNDPSILHKHIATHMGKTAQIEEKAEVAPLVRLETHTDSKSHPQVLNDMDKNEKGTTYVCDQCESVFPGQSQLYGHMSKHATKNKKGFKSSIGLNKQIEKSRVAERPVELFCSSCDRKFCDKGSLRRHMRTHAGKRPCVCPVCSKGFYKLNSLKAHINTHIPEKPHGCIECGVLFRTARKLKGHRLTHINEKRRRCPVCGDRFSTANGLKGHMLATAHAEVKPEVSSVCGVTLNMASTLEVPMMIHAEERSLECFECKETFYAKADLEMHMVSHNEEKSCSCSECGQTFTAANDLETHMLSHSNRELVVGSGFPNVYPAGSRFDEDGTSEAGVQWKNCTQCGVSFSQPTDTDVANSPVICSLCRTEFKKMFDLDV